MNAPHVVWAITIATLMPACSSSDATAPAAVGDAGSIEAGDTGSSEAGDAATEATVDAGPVCPGTTCDGACVVGTCEFAVTAITAVAAGGGASDWVSGGAFFTVKGSGFAKGMKVFLGDGRAPVRVIDAETATIQAPPGLEGRVDVRIELAGKTSSTKGAFTYQSGPIEGAAAAQVTGFDRDVLVMSRLAYQAATPDAPSSSLEQPKGESMDQGGTSRAASLPIGAPREKAGVYAVRHPP